MGSLDLTCSQVHCIILTDKEASSGLQTCNSRGQPPLLLNHTLRICSLRKTFYTFYLPSLRTRINRLITKRCLRFDRCTLSCFFNLKLNNWIKVIQFTSCQLSGSKSTETGDFCFVQHFQHSYSFFLAWPWVSIFRNKEPNLNWSNESRRNVNIFQAFADFFCNQGLSFSVAIDCEIEKNHSFRSLKLET